MKDEKRGTGRTTKLMRGAYKGSYYVWPTNFTDPARWIAEDIGRSDLQIIPPSHLVSLYYRAIGKTNPPPVIIDHATKLTYEQSMGLLRYEEERKRTKQKEK